MGAISKRMQEAAKKIDKKKVYPFEEAVNLAKEISSKIKFDESFDVSVKLGVDPKKSDQMVRSSAVLPNGTGKSVRVAVMTQGANAEKATKAGADIVGFEDLADKIQADAKAGNKLEFDVLIATPDAMRIVGKLGRILGPKNLMPNPKVGTVTTDVETAVNNAKSGQVSFRTDKGGLVHCTIGKVSFETKALKENVEAILACLRKAKPATSKGIYLQKISISSTMGPGFAVDLNSLSI